MDASGLGVLAVGAVLCFAAVRSLNLAVFGSGFAVGWLITEPFDATFLPALIVALAVAVVAVVLARIVFRAALFFIGGIAGAIIFGLLQPEDGSVLLLVLFVVATGSSAAWRRSDSIGPRSPSSAPRAARRSFSAASPALSPTSSASSAIRPTNGRPC